MVKVNFDVNMFNVQARGEDKTKRAPYQNQPGREGVGPSPDAKPSVVEYRVRCLDCKKTKKTENWVESFKYNKSETLEETISRQQDFLVSMVDSEERLKNAKIHEIAYSLLGSEDAFNALDGPLKVIYLKMAKRAWDHFMGLYTGSDSYNPKEG